MMAQGLEYCAHIYQSLARKILSFSFTQIFYDRIYYFLLTNIAFFFFKQYSHTIIDFIRQQQAKRDFKKPQTPEHQFFTFSWL